MNILTFDTSSEIMYVTLGKDDKVLESVIIPSTEQNYNSAFFVSTIVDILKNNNLIMQDIKALGVNIGPGSFTGLRAAITVARVIAQQLDIPVIGIPSLQIYSMLNKSDKESFCIMDARRGRAYIGVYDQNFEPKTPPSIMEYEKAFELFQNKDYFIISDNRIAKKLEGKQLQYIEFSKTSDDLGVFLFKQVLKKIKQDNLKEFNWQNIKPLYLQSPAITISKNKNNRIKN